MTDDIAIRVRGLGKKYTIGGSQEKYLTFRDAKSQFTKKGSAVCMSIVYVCDGSVMIEEKEQ